MISSALNASMKRTRRAPVGPKFHSSQSLRIMVWLGMPTEVELVSKRTVAVPLRPFVESLKIRLWDQKFLLSTCGLFGVPKNIHDPTPDIYLVPRELN